MQFFLCLLLLFVCSIHFFILYYIFICFGVSKRFRSYIHIACVCVLNYVQISGTVTIITVMSILVIILNCLSRIKLFLLYFFFLYICWFVVSLLLECCCYCCYFCCHYYHTIAQIAFYDICIVTSISYFIYINGHDITV